MHTIRRTILSALADAYEKSTAARKGAATRPFRVLFRILMADANCADGDALVVATAELRRLAAEGVISLRHGRRDPDTLTHVELAITEEDRLYRMLGRPSPTELRAQLGAIFRNAAGLKVREIYRRGWEQMCLELAFAAETGKSVDPFFRGDPAGTPDLLRGAAQLLNWETESLLRFASCQIFRNSKRLGECRGTLERILARATNGEVTSLSSLGIMENPRSCHISGPAVLHFPEGVVDLRGLKAPWTFSMADIVRLVRVETPAARFCSIENPTTFHELAKISRDTLLACTDGYAGSALLAFVAKLPALKMFHFGDSDPAGFDILSDLRQRSGRDLVSLHMAYRPASPPEPLSVQDRLIAERVLKTGNLTELEKTQIRLSLTTSDKGVFEQEMLGIPQLMMWPFYAVEQQAV